MSKAPAHGRSFYVSAAPGARALLIVQGPPLPPDAIDALRSAMFARLAKLGCAQNGCALTDNEVTYWDRGGPATFGIFLCCEGMLDAAHAVMTEVAGANPHLTRT